jgi:anti-sigma B factor antagonist
MTQSPDVQMSIRHLPEASIISIKGEITGFAETSLMEAYAEANRTKPHAVILNFSDLEYMNSTGIGLLVTLLIRAQRQQQRLMACGLNSHYKQIFDLTRLNEAIGIYETESQALAAVALPQ